MQGQPMQQANFGVDPSQMQLGKENENIILRRVL